MARYLALLFALSLSSYVRSNLETFGIGFVNDQLTSNILHFHQTLSQFTRREILLFDVFKSVFNKSYINAIEEQTALLKFLVNQRDIEEHNLKYEAGLVTFSRAVWERSDMTAGEVNRLMNGFIKPVEAKLAKENDVLFKAPKSLSWVKRGYVTEGSKVQNQMLCGACWSFATTGAIEGQIFRKTGLLDKLSDQNLIDCNRDVEIGNYGCSGGDMITAFEYLIDREALTLAKEYPYKAADWFNCIPRSSAPNANLTSFETIESGDETLLQDFLAMKGPIAIAIDASLSSFQSYKSGVYFDEMCSIDINHAVLLVGYGRDKKTKEDYWLVKNSYGAEWGENGYFRIARNANNHCGITEFPSVPVL